MKTLLLLLLSVQLALSATFYVDYSGGSDASAGTSTGTAFKRCPGDSAATGTAASTTLVAGDTVIFKGGVTYTLGGATGIALSWSGTPASPITYDGNSAGTWGTGRPILTDGYSANSIAAFATGSNSRSNLVFRNFEIGPIGGSSVIPTDMGSAVAARPGYGITLSAKATGIYITDCWFHNLGYHWNSKPMDANSIDGIGVYSVNCGGVTVTNSTFNRMMIGVANHFGTAGSTNMLIVSNRFSDSIVWCSDNAATATGAQMDRLTIRGNTFIDYYQLDEGLWTGYGDWPHTDGIFYRCDFADVQYGTNINFHGNTFVASAGSGGGTADIYITEGPSANIYNNVFNNGGKGRTIFLNGGPYSPGASRQLVRILNNSFITDYTAHISTGPSSGNALGTLDIRNNVHYDTLTGSGNNFAIYYADTYITNVLYLDFNIYKTFNTSSLLWGGTTFGERTLTQMRAIGFETNGLATDPLFTTLSTPATNNVLTLQSTSPAIGVGTNLTAYSWLPDLNKDFRGWTRSTSTNWTLGAYTDVNVAAYGSANVPSVIGPGTPNSKTEF